MMLIDKGLRFENAVNEDLVLTVRYVKLQEAVGVWDYLHDKTGLYSDKVYRIVDCNSTTGMCTISAEAFVGYKQVTDRAEFFNLSIQDGDTVYSYSDVYNNLLSSDVILSESKEVSPNISYLKAELQPADVSQFIPITNAGGAGNSGTSVPASQYEMYYKAEMPMVTVKVVDKFLAEDNSVENTIVRLTEEISEGSIVEYNALSPIPEGYSLLGDSTKNMTAVPDLVVEFQYRKVINSTPTPSSKPTATPTPEPTQIPQPTIIPEPSPSPKPTATPTPTPSPKPTATPTPESTQIPQPTIKPETTPFPEPTSNPEPTPSPEITPTPEPVVMPSQSPEPTKIPQPTIIPEPSPSPKPTATPTPSPKPTATPTPSPKPTATPTPSPKPTETPSIESEIEQEGRKITLNGYVYYKDGTPIANKLIEVHSEPRYAVTDENGYYEIKDVSVGNHEFTIYSGVDNTSEQIVSCDLLVDELYDDTVVLTFKAKDCEVNIDTSLTNILQIDAILPLYELSVVDKYIIEAEQPVVVLAFGGYLTETYDSCESAVGCVNVIEYCEVRDIAILPEGAQYFYSAKVPKGFEVDEENKSGIVNKHLTIEFLYRKRSLRKNK